MLLSMGHAYSKDLWDHWRPWLLSFFPGHPGYLGVSGNPGAEFQGGHLSLGIFLPRDIGPWNFYSKGHLSLGIFLPRDIYMLNVPWKKKFKGQMSLEIKISRDICPLKEKFQGTNVPLGTLISNSKK